MRSDNILVDGGGSAFIIDFDRASSETDWLKNGFEADEIVEACENELSSIKGLRDNAVAD